MTLIASVLAFALVVAVVVCVAAWVVRTDREVQADIRRDLDGWWS